MMSPLDAWKNGRGPRIGSARWLVAFVLAALLPVEPCQSRGTEGTPRADAAILSAAPESAQFFDAHIAPMLARHCLECHDSSTRKGKLDLSRRDAAFAGGKNGKAIVPGKSAESLVWESVESGDMPEDRPALSGEEMRLLRAWIDAGAKWSGDEIDPQAVRRDRRAAQSLVRRLTVPEYIETVRSAVGVDIAKDARRILPPEVRADGFSNTAYNLNTDLGHVEAYARLARNIIKRMDVTKFTALFSTDRELGDDAMRELIARMGWWLLRGPLDEDEIVAFLRIPRAVVADGGKYEDAAALLVEAMLQAPRFIYRIEEQNGDGTPRRLNHHELASRLSYLVWGAPPDAELMRAADSCELADRASIEAQVRRMLQDPRAVERSAQFISEWLHLDRLENLRPDKKRYPNWSAQLATDMRDETLAFFKEIVWVQKRALPDLLNAEVTFATPRLAALYGLPRRPLDVPKDVPRRNGGLQALYLFQEGSGDVIRDISGAGEPLDLKIEDASAVAWENGQLTVKGPALLATAAPPKRLIAAVKKSRAITIEAWVTPADGKQSGPARIVTLSSGANLRNFTLGQDGDKFEVRLRTGATSTNGTPGLSSASRTTGPRLTHIVHTREASGRTKLYIDGEESGASEAGGDLTTWDDTFRLALANELTRDRPWRGTFHRVAIYSRALTSDELGATGGAQRYDLSAIPARGGLLTQGSVLTMGGDEASMVERGLFILHDLLYSAVGNAPPGTDTTPVPTKPGQSQRTVAEARLANQSCTNCHSKFEPLAFGFEKFDGIGAYHEKDRHGNPLREDGEILLPGTERPVAYKTTAELMTVLARSDRVRMNFTRKLAQFALGRPLVESDAQALETIHTSAWKIGGTYPSLITALALSELVQTTGTETRTVVKHTTP